MKKKEYVKFSVEGRLYLEGFLSKGKWSLWLLVDHTIELIEADLNSDQR